MPVALGIQTPQINGVENFNASQANATQQKSIQMEQERAALEQIATMGLGVMGGKLDGEINPEAFDQMIGVLGDNPLATKLKGNPELLRAITNGSINVITASHNAEEFELRKKQFDTELQQAELNGPIDRAYKVAQTEALTAKPAVPPTDDQKELVQINAERKAKGLDPLDMEAYQAAKKSNTGFSVTTNPDGTVSVVQGAKPLTEGQSKDTVFTARAAGALPIVDALGDKLTSLGENVVGKIPYGGYLQSDEYQQADNAGREFLAALLRKDSGAAITEPEMQNYGGIYLPQPGDKPGVLLQKKAARARAVKAITLGLPPQAIISLEAEGVDIPDMPGSDAAAAASGSTEGDYPEGTVIANDRGEQMVMKSGKWVSVQ